MSDKKNGARTAGPNAAHTEVPTLRGAPSNHRDIGPGALGRAALDYATNRGWPVFPVHTATDGLCSCGRACSKPGKHPRTKGGFKDATTDPAQIEAWWKRWPDAGIGFVPGSAGLFVLDIDPEGQALAETLHLPPTLSVRTGRGHHRYFLHPGSGPVGNSPLAPGVDVRADAGYVILPPSLHPSGVRYEWLPDPTEPVPLPPGLRKGPDVPEVVPEGTRNTRLTQYAGELIALGLGPEEVLERVWQKNLTDCHPPLAYAEVAAIVRNIAKKDARTVHPAVAKLNVDHALILVGDKAAVLVEEGDSFRLLGVGAFKEWLRPHRVQVGGKAIPLADFWLNNRHRREYRGIVFDPTDRSPQYYNLWRTWAVEPSPTGSCDRFLHHLRQNMCRDDGALYAYALGWFAHLVQRPADKLGTSLAVRGKQGTGKSIIGATLGHLLGRHYSAVSDPRYITGRFNSYMIDCLLLHADEGFWAGDKAAEGRLKDLVTGVDHFIEFKGKEPIRVKNHVRLLVTGNADWIVPAGLEERRFAVFEMGEGALQDHRYFGAMVAELEQGGYAKLLHTLLHHDLSKVDLRLIPNTAALYEQKMASLSPEQAWWLDTLTNGLLPGDGAGTGCCPTQFLYDRFIAHAQKAGTRRRSIETQVGVFLRRYAPGLRKREGELAGRRLTFYEFPSLKVCRAAFARETRHPGNWDEPSAWVPDE